MKRPRHALALDRVILRERAWLDLTMLRFVTHPGFPHAFPDYLVDLYHAMRTAGAVMEAARRRSIDLSERCPVAARLVDYWAQHIADEAGHDGWLLEDLDHFGIDVTRALALPPAPEVAELLGTLHFWVLHTHPVAALAYFYVVERNPPSAALLDWMVDMAGVPRAALRTFYRHAEIDVEHARELAEVLDSLPLTAAHRQLLTLSATTVIRQLGRIMERHVEAATACTEAARAKDRRTARPVLAHSEV